MLKDDIGFNYEFRYSFNHAQKNLIENCLLFGLENMASNGQLSNEEQLEIIQVFNAIRRLQPDIMDIKISDIKEIFC